MTRIPQEDLVGYAMHGLDDAEMARIEAGLDDAARAEVGRIRGHLALHDHAPEIAPAPALWRGIEECLDHQPVPRTLLRRFWMPLAAAALMLLALALNTRTTPPLRVQRLHGGITANSDGSYTSTTVARVALDDGVQITMDRDTTILPLSNERLALKAGRIFLNVTEGRRGFTVTTAALTVVTTGTAFLVESERVAVVSGSVRCTWNGESRSVAEGEDFNPLNVDCPNPTEWFSRPTLSAQILTPTRIRIVIRNEMPDRITLAPPTGGEPLFFASYDGHDHPLSTSEFLAEITLARNGKRTFDVSLPTPLADRDALFVSSPALNLRVEAAR